jgi:hypothetical protein
VSMSGLLKSRQRRMALEDARPLLMVSIPAVDYFAAHVPVDHPNAGRAWLGRLADQITLVTRRQEGGPLNEEDPDVFRE